MLTILLIIVLILLLTGGGPSFRRPRPLAPAAPGPTTLLLLGLDLSRASHRVAREPKQKSSFRRKP